MGGPDRERRRWGDRRKVGRRAGGMCTRASSRSTNGGRRWRNGRQLVLRRRQRDGPGSNSERGRGREGRERTARALGWARPGRDDVDVRMLRASVLSECICAV